MVRVREKLEYYKAGRGWRTLLIWEILNHSQHSPRLQWFNEMGGRVNLWDFLKSHKIPLAWEKIKFPDLFCLVEAMYSFAARAYVRYIGGSKWMDRWLDGVLIDLLIRSSPGIIFCFANILQLLLGEHMYSRALSCVSSWETWFRQNPVSEGIVLTLTGVWDGPASHFILCCEWSALESKEKDKTIPLHLKIMKAFFVSLRWDPVFEQCGKVAGVCHLTCEII